jgi:hypothetical protein
MDTHGTRLRLRWTSPLIVDANRPFSSIYPSWQYDGTSSSQRTATWIQPIMYVRSTSPERGIYPISGYYMSANSFWCVLLSVIIHRNLHPTALWHIQALMFSYGLDRHYKAYCNYFKHWNHQIDWYLLSTITQKISNCWQISSLSWYTSILPMSHFPFQCFKNTLKSTKLLNTREQKRLFGS